MCTFENDDLKLNCEICLSIRSENSSLSADLALTDNDIDVTGSSTLKSSNLSACGKETQAGNAIEVIDVDAEEDTSVSNPSSSAFVPRPLYNFLHCPYHSDPSLNANSLTVKDIFSGSPTHCILSNYMITADYLLDQAPILKTIPTIVLASDLPRNTELTSPLTLTRKPRTSKWGVHHSKFVILLYPTGLRLSIFTANFIAADLTYLTNAVHTQDFPRDPKSPTCAFQDDLISYLRSTRGVDNNMFDWFSAISSHDFRGATGTLVTSVPGRHKPPRYGIETLKQRLLRVHGNADDTVYCQFSSLGSTSEKQYRPLLDAFQTTSASNSVSPHMTRLVWPTLDSVQSSYAGINSGGSIPCQMKNMYGDSRSGQPITPHPHLAALLHKPIGPRTKASLHIKTFARHSVSNEILWFLLSSHNMSRAAWGQYELKGTQLKIEHYELGILFIPEDMVGDELPAFSCTPNHPKMGLKGVVNTKPLRFPSRPKFIPGDTSSVGRTGDGTHVVEIGVPFPYEFPPPPYRKRGDHPWCSEFYRDQDWEFGEMDVPPSGPPTSQEKDRGHVRKAMADAAEARMKRSKTGTET